MYVSLHSLNSLVPSWKELFRGCNQGKTVGVRLSTWRKKKKNRGKNPAFTAFQIAPQRTLQKPWKSVSSSKNDIICFLVLFYCSPALARCTESDSSFYFTIIIKITVWKHNMIKCQKLFFGFFFHSLWNINVCNERVPIRPQPPTSIWLFGRGWPMAVLRPLSDTLTFSCSG